MDSKNKNKATPVDLMNIMLGYDDFNPLKGHGSALLVPTLFNSITTQKIARLKELLTAIVNGKPDKVKAMLEKDPSLLLEKLDENDYVTALTGQRCNHVTAYRTALAVEDTQMAVMIKNKLIEVAGKDAANTQYREQFPDGWEIDEAKRWESLIMMLEILKNVIRDAKPGDILSSGGLMCKLTVREGSDVAFALALFRSELDDRLFEIVTTGRHFNPHLLLKASEIWNDVYHNASWGDPRCLLFWQQVIGTIQRALPVNYIQALCGGLDSIEKDLRNNIPQNRSMHVYLYYPRGRLVWVYPLSKSSLGFDYAIYCGMECGYATPGSPWDTYFAAYTAQSLFKTKAACMRALMPRVSLCASIRGCLSL